MTSTVHRAAHAVNPRAACEGVTALAARLEPWQVELCSRPEIVDEWLELHGSPVNVLDPTPMARNAAELQAAAARFGLDLGIYFARKANKALGFVDEARRLGLGIDLASERELRQVLDRRVPPGDLVMTAAVKPRSLLELCVASGTTVVVDNADELERLTTIARESGRVTPIAMRLAPVLADDRLPTRFGFDEDEAIAAAEKHCPAGREPSVRIDGVHFHLDGYDAGDRVSALAQSLDLVDALRRHGHQPAFIDMGGGIPISYLASSLQWDRFWREHRKGLLGHREPLTFEGNGLGLIAHNGEILGAPAVYPYHQQPTRGDWLTEVLAGRAGAHGSVAEALRGRDLQLRCEPGRSLLDGCGLTAARVEHRKQRRDGTWLIGVAMNRTQCRSASADFLVDPLLLRPATKDPASATKPIEGYLAGAYCIERELLTWRRLSFPEGVEVGDIVVFPNTAGYLMHILESSSHQIPLARNLILGADRESCLDPIDQPI